jgi:hypothetical protein
MFGLELTACVAFRVTKEIVDGRYLWSRSVPRTDGDEKRQKGDLLTDQSKMCTRYVMAFGVRSDVEMSRVSTGSGRVSLRRLRWRVIAK